jgi:hypothetical protein
LLLLDRLDDGIVEENVQVAELRAGLFYDRGVMMDFQGGEITCAEISNFRAEG